MKVRLSTSLCFAVSLLTSLALPLYAEEVKLPVGQQAAEKQSLQRPANGMNKEQVEVRYGKPVQIRSAVGDPPISAWEYGDFVVYFERDLVLHSVLKKD